jgi:hypothetical protein
VVLLSPHPRPGSWGGVWSGVLGPGLTCERLTPLRLSCDLNCRPGPRFVPGTHWLGVPICPSCLEVGVHRTVLAWCVPPLNERKGWLCSS